MEHTFQAHSSAGCSRYASCGTTHNQTKQVMTADEWADLVCVYSERRVSLVTVALRISTVPLIRAVLVNKTWCQHKEPKCIRGTALCENPSFCSVLAALSAFLSCGVNRLNSVAPSTTSSPSVGDPDAFPGQLGWAIPPACFGFCQRVRSLVTPSRKHLRREEPCSSEHLSCFYQREKQLYSELLP